MTDQRSLQAIGLGLGYGERSVISGLDLDIAPGQITSIVGANGCGKSTLLRALARLLVPQSGQVVLDGLALQERPTKELAKILGLLPQSPTAPEGIVVADLVGRGRHPHQGSRIGGPPGGCHVSPVAEGGTQPLPTHHTGAGCLQQGGGAGVCG